MQGAGRGTARALQQNSALCTCSTLPAALTHQAPTVGVGGLRAEADNGWRRPREVGPCTAAEQELE